MFCVYSEERLVGDKLFLGSCSPIFLIMPFLGKRPSKKLCKLGSWPLLQIASFWMVTKFIQVESVSTCFLVLLCLSWLSFSSSSLYCCLSRIRVGKHHSTSTLKYLSQLVSCSTAHNIFKLHPTLRQGVFSPFCQKSLFLQSGRGWVCLYGLIFLPSFCLFFKILIQNEIELRS